MTSSPHGKSAPPALLIVGCGYVGSAVADFALGQGLAVTALTRDAAFAETLRRRGIRVIVADAAKDDWHAALPERFDFVLNSLSGGGAGLAGYRHSYLEGMASLLRWASARGGVGTLVYTSSTSVYPQGGGALVSEADVRGGETGNQRGDREQRAAILREAERRLMAAEGVCRRWFVLRLAGIYGPGRQHLVDQVRAGAVAGVAAHHLNLVHRDDIVAAIWACFTAPGHVGSTVFNVADNGRAAKHEIIEWLANEMGLPPPAFTAAPVSGRQDLTPDRIISNQKLKEVLGWSPRHPTFREGYRDILRRAVPMT